jgi:heme A synthase
LANRSALLLLSLCAPAALLAFCVDAPVLHGVAALAVTTFPVALIALGSRKSLRGPLAALWIVLTGGFCVLLALPDGGPDVIFGLPLGTAVMLFGLVPVPFALVCWAYAARFDLRDEDLERLRKRREG